MAATRDLVSVIVPTRNRRTLLERTLRTVLWQTHEALEVVVVDEASTDDTPSYLASLTDPRVRWVRNDVPGGVARARNRGMAETSAPWVAWVDDDDLWAPDKLESQLAAIQATPGARWSFVEAVVVDVQLQPVRWQRIPPAPDLAARLLEVNEVPGGASGVLAERALVDAVGHFDPAFKHAADWDLWTRLALAAPAAPVGRPLLAYLRHQSMSNVATGKYEDVDLIERKYADERSSRGVGSPRLANLHWVGESALRGGDRKGAARAYWAASRLPDNRRSLLRLALSQVPGYLRIYDLLKRQVVPGDRGASVEPWLDVLRQPAGPSDLSP